MPAKDVYFEDALKQVRQAEYISGIELQALIMAARGRGRLEELDRIYEYKTNY